MEPLKAQAVAAFKWSTLSALAGKAITPLVFLVLAHVLMPEDFGVAAIATITISFSQVFWDLGLSKALIQRQGDVEAVASISSTLRRLSGKRKYSQTAWLMISGGKR